MTVRERSATSRRRRGLKSGRNLFRAACFLTVTSIGFLVPVVAASAGETESAQLKQLRARIDQLQERLNETRGRRDDVREEVRDLERRIGKLLHQLRQSDIQLRANESKLKSLNARVTRERKQLGAHRMHLAQQITTAYRMGRQEYVKMLLNQQDPVQFARVTAYYRYLNQARVERIGMIRTGLDRLESLEQEIRTQQRELDQLRSGKQERKDALEQSRARRSELLASLNREVRDQSRQIERLRADEKRLERLIDELKIVVAPPPPVGDRTPFAKLRGQLPLPTHGRILSRFGGSKNVGNLKWRGLLIGGKEGQNIVSVYRGRVVFSDWLRGFGLLLILDHGDGYMTLYGHNQSLHKGVGDWVEAGEVIAGLGSTGDVAQPGLYFEIRQHGEPRDPLIWCKAR